MYDYDGDMSVYQKQLDEAGVNYDITNLAGATQREIESVMGALLLIAAKKRAVQNVAV